MIPVDKSWLIYLSKALSLGITFLENVYAEPATDDGKAKMAFMRQMTFSRGKFVYFNYYFFSKGNLASV